MLGIVASIVISGLVVSTGPVPADAVDDYKEWGANHVTVWQADESTYWSGLPTTVWIDEEGRGMNWQRQPYEYAPTGNVVRQQVGDEPSKHPFPIVNPDTQYTNFSYWAPLANGEWPEEQMPRIMDEYDGTHFTTSEYLIRGDDRLTHWSILDFFAKKAQGNGQSWGVYLNGYSGYETNFQKDHTKAELYAHAFGAQAFGATEFVWFSYAFGPDGHDEARQGGGSIITEDGTWERGPMWQTTAAINHGLRLFSRYLQEPLRGTQIDENSLTGLFGGTALHVAFGDAVVDVDGYVVRPNGTAVYLNGAYALSDGDVILVTPVVGEALEAR